MFHLVMLGIVAALAVGGWALIRSAPRSLSLLLPAKPIMLIGAGLFVFAVFNAFASAYGLRDPEAMIGGMVQGFVGLWLMLAPSAGMRGSYSDDLMLRRLFTMVALLLFVIVASLYVRDHQAMALLNLALVGGGFLIVRDFLRRPQGG